MPQQVLRTLLRSCSMPLNSWRSASGMAPQATGSNIGTEIECRGSPVAHQHEDDCRNVLLSDLQQMLQPYSVDAQPEGRYANDNRADIRVASGSRLAIPIEIKKYTHRDIWRGVEKTTRGKVHAGPGVWRLWHLSGVLVWA